MTETSRVAILFADVSGSTRLYDTVGDTKARGIVGRYMHILETVTGEREGTVVKTIGDEVMCIFPSADHAAAAATRMQEVVAATDGIDGVKLSVRIGFHEGPVIHEKGDVFGDAVNVAARMAGEAKAGQIITSGESTELLSVGYRAKARFLIETAVKGKKQPMRLFELTWGETELLTVVAMPAMATGPIGASGVGCTLAYGDQSYKVSGTDDSMTLGRGLQNTLVVPHTKASRIHATISFRRGKFILVDQSTNGTYVRPLEGPLFVVHREEAILSGEGVIGLGLEFSMDSVEAIRYAVEG